jgi:hypothetical protein
MTYEFTLILALPAGSPDPATWADALYESGCDDAVLGIGARGVIALEFDREAASAEKAIRSAIACAQRAIPDARLIEVKPDLVNLSDLADLLQCSRQNMRKYAAGEIKGVQAPFPVPSFSGSPNLWHLYEVSRWLSAHTELRPPAELLELARTTCQVNLELAQKIANNSSSGSSQTSGSSETENTEVVAMKRQIDEAMGSRASSSPTFRSLLPQRQFSSQELSFEPMFEAAE